MSQLFDAIKEGMESAKAPADLQEKIKALISDAINTPDTSQAQPYRKISLEIFKALKPFDDYYPSRAERLIPNIMATNSFVLQDFLDYERQLKDKMSPIKQALGLRPAWIFPAQILVGALGFILGVAGVTLLAIPFAVLFNFTLQNPFLVFVAIPAGLAVGKEFFLGTAIVAEDSRIPQAIEKDPKEVARLSAYKAMNNLLRINYQNPVDMSSMKMAIKDTTSAFVLSQPEKISELMQIIINALKSPETEAASA